MRRTHDTKRSCNLTEDQLKSIAAVKFSVERISFVRDIFFAALLTYADKEIKAGRNNSRL